MAKRDYSKYSKKNTDAVTNDVEVQDAVPVVEEPVTPEVTPVASPVTETVETVTLPKTVTGKVANCSKLNIRVKPITTADVVCVLVAGTEVEIDTNRSTSDWLKIRTSAGVNGYCMRKFVDAQL